MNKNTNIWAVKVGRPDLFEVVQRIAFSFGYGWSSLRDNKVVINKDVLFIYFNPVNKMMIPITRSTINVELDVCKICLSIEEVLDTLKNPPVVKVEKDEKQPQRLPAVQFIYNSPSSGRRLRRVLVSDSTLDYLTGLDVQDKNLFKRFSKSRIVGPMMFMGFSETKY